MSSECAAAAADGGERRDPSEKQEPYTVMWGKRGGRDWYQDRGIIIIKRVRITRE